MFKLVFCFVGESERGLLLCSLGRKCINAMRDYINDEATFRAGCTELWIHFNVGITNNVE